MLEQSINLPHKHIGVAVIYNQQGRILIDRRLPQGAFGGLWEFPGGKIELGETVEECIQREIFEELGIEISVGDRLITLEHTYSHFRVTLYVHECDYRGGEPQPLACEQILWVLPEELPQFSFPSANRQIIEKVLSIR